MLEDKNISGAKPNNHHSENKSSLYDSHERLRGESFSSFCNSASHDDNNDGGSDDNDFDDDAESSVPLDKGWAWVVCFGKSLLNV